jgi:hypothetical protein
MFEGLLYRIIYGRDWVRIRAIFIWLGGILSGEDVVSLVLRKRSINVRFRFPLRIGELPKIVFKEDMSPTFLIQDFEGAEHEELMHIFSSQSLHIYERRRKLPVAPLRWGMNHNEKIILLKAVRHIITELMQNRLAQNIIDENRFNISVDLNIAVWVDGNLRASRIAQNVHLIRGLVTVAQDVLRDSRFAPLTIEEIDRSRIEIGILHEPRVALGGNEIIADRIMPDKGYTLGSTIKDNSYLPEVFNTRRWDSLKKLIHSLVTEKARLSATKKKIASVCTFEITDFVETKNKRDVIDLYSTMPIPQTLSIENQKQRFSAAADWLLSMQTRDGNIRSNIDPLTGSAGEIDPVRTAFSGLALASYGKKTEEQRYVDAANKVLDLITSKMIDDVNKIHPLEYIYAGQLAETLNRRDIRGRIMETFQDKFQSLHFEPVLVAQAAKFLFITGHKDQASYILSELRSRFYKNRQKGIPMSLAAWAEVGNIAFEDDIKFAHEVLDWIVRHQLENGAFPDTSSSNFVYTRGTGKIFEVLAVDHDRYKNAITNSLKWLFSMQYIGETDWFIPLEYRGKVLGSFRHDYINTEAWVDSVAHVLLGASRLTDEAL